MTPRGYDITFFNIEIGFAPVVGREAIIGWGSLIDCLGQVTIGDFVFFGHQVMICTGSHDTDKLDRERQDAVFAKPVTIERGAWIGSRALILPGVTIGEHAVVGAGSVVTHDVAPRHIVAGNPARQIGWVP